MAVYTDVSDEELSTFLAKYGIGNLLSFKGIAEGVENTNYFVQTSEGNFILTLYEKRVNPKDLPFFLELMVHLSKKDISCPIPIRQESGKYLDLLANRPAVIVSFLEGMWIRRPQAHHCTALGETLAGLHLAAKNFDMRRSNSLSIESWKELFNKIRDHADKFHDGLKNEIERELENIEVSWPRDLPEGIIHADLFPDNVFFLDDRLSGLIDFYFACNDYWAYDLAICMNSWCFEPDHSFNVTKARALVEGYRKIRNLGDDELDALATLARGSAMRFLLTRLHDWQNVPPGALVRPKDPMEYIRKLRFHQTIKTPSDYGLQP